MTTGSHGGFATFYKGNKQQAVTKPLEPGYYAVRVQATNAMGFGEPSMAIEVEVVPVVRRVVGDDVGAMQPKGPVVPDARACSTERKTHV